MQPDLFSNKTPQIVFNKAEGRRQRDAGIRAAADPRFALLLKVREGVKAVARTRANRTATSDDAHAWLLNNGHADHALGKGMGALFKEDSWVFTGQYTASARTCAHARPVKIWVLRDGD
jgi:hypothetical protein